MFRQITVYVLKCLIITTNEISAILTEKNKVEDDAKKVVFKL